MGTVAAFELRDDSPHGSLAHCVANETLGPALDPVAAAAAAAARAAKVAVSLLRMVSAVQDAAGTPRPPPTSLDTASVPTPSTKAPEPAPATAKPKHSNSRTRTNETRTPEATDTLADLVSAQTHDAGLQLYRISRTFKAPTLEAARARLQAARGEVFKLGTAHGFIGAVDRRSEPDKRGNDAHLYLLFSAANDSEAELVRRAALGDLSARGVGEHFDPVGDTADDVRRSVNYCLKRWPLAAGARDSDLDIVAAGSFAELWAEHRPAVLKAGKVKACGHCGAELRADYAQRKTRPGPDGVPVAGYCSNACKHRAFRRAKKARATQAPMGQPRLALVKSPKPEPIQAKPTEPTATQAPMNQSSRPVLVTSPLDRAAQEAVERLGWERNHADLERETLSILADDFEPEPAELTLRRAVRHAAAGVPKTLVQEATP